MFCKAFNKALVIEPGKTLAVCCSDVTRMLKTNLSEITDLNNFFSQGEAYTSIRNQIKNSSCVTEFDPCMACHRSKDGFSTEMDLMNEHRFKNSDNSIDLKFLEVTTSNICKQSCVMCGSKYSSTHAKINNHPGAISFLSPQELEMIYDVLPNLDFITLKGGEPFADQNNLKILKKIFEVNKNIKNISIISNGQNISKSFKEILSKFSESQIKLSFSIDGVDKLYEWQRGSQYSSTVDTINSFHKDTGLTYVIINTITAFTFPSILESFKRHLEDLKGVRYYTSNNIVWSPAWQSPSLYSQETIDEIVQPILDFQSSEIGWNRNGLESIRSYGDSSQIESFKRDLEKWNQIRKIKIEEFVPELKLIQ